MVNQLVIAAGGNGDRLGLGSKPLINYLGHPLIHYVISFALESGFKEFYISVNKDNKEGIKTIAENIGIEYVLHEKAPGFRGTPLLFEEYLDTKFGFIAGHHVIPTYHYSLLQKAAKDKEVIFTVYNNKKYFAPIKDLILLNDDELMPSKEPIPENFSFIDHPYILTKQLMLDLRKENFKKSINQMILGINCKEKIKAINAIMPPEFDYKNEWEIFKQYLYDYLVPY